MIRDLILREEGQSTVEYMLLISVIVIAIVAAAYVFIDPFKRACRTSPTTSRRSCPTARSAASALLARLENQPHNIADRFAHLNCSDLPLRLLL